MCLADFVSGYRVVQTKCEDEVEGDDEVDIEADTTTTKVVKLLDNKGAIRKRKKEAVIRYLKVYCHS